MLVSGSNNSLVGLCPFGKMSVLDASISYILIESKGRLEVSNLIEEREDDRNIEVNHIDVCLDQVMELYMISFYILMFT